LLIAHSPRASSVTPEKTFPLPGTVAGLRFALFERCGLVCEVDIRCFLVRRLLAGQLAGEAALPFFYFRTGLNVLAACHGNRCFTPIRIVGVLRLPNLRPLIPCYPMAQPVAIINPGRVDISLIRGVRAGRKQDLSGLLRNVKNCF
jgi:hypothetical protein